MTDEAEIRDCGNCAVRERARDIAKTQGPEAAISYRTGYCVTCEHNPNMGTIKAMGLDGVLGALSGMFGRDMTVKDNWVPIEPAKTNPRGFMKRCADCDQHRVKDCKVSPELNAECPPDECPIVYDMERGKNATGNER